MILFEEYRKINDPYFDNKSFEISNLGNIKKVVYINKYRESKGLKILKNHGIIIKQI